MRDFTEVNPKGFQILEALIATVVVLTMSLALSYFINNYRTTSHQISDYGTCQRTSDNFFSQVKEFSNSIVVRNYMPQDNSGVNWDTPVAAGGILDPFCNASPFRKIFCDSVSYYTTGPTGTGQASDYVTFANGRYQLGANQNMRSSASWALGLYNSCGVTARAQGVAPCPVAGDICTGSNGLGAPGITFTAAAGGPSLDDLSKLMPRSGVIKFDSQVSAVSLQIKPNASMGVNCGASVTSLANAKFDVKITVTLKDAKSKDADLSTQITNSSCSSSGSVAYEPDSTKPYFRTNSDIPVTMFSLSKRPDDYPLDQPTIAFFDPTDDKVYDAFAANRPVTARIQLIPNAKTVIPVGDPACLCDNAEWVASNTDPAQRKCPAYTRSVYVEATANETGVLFLCNRKLPTSDGGDGPDLYKYCAQMSLADNAGDGDLIQEGRPYLRSFNAGNTLNVAGGVNFNEPFRPGIRWDLPETANGKEFNFSVLPVDQAGNAGNKSALVRFQVKEPICDPNDPAAKLKCPSEHVADACGQTTCPGTWACDAATLRCPAGAPNPKNYAIQEGNKCSVPSVLCPYVLPVGAGCGDKTTYCSKKDACGYDCPAGNKPCPDPSNLTVNQKDIKDCSDNVCPGSCTCPSDLACGRMADDSCGHVNACHGPVCPQSCTCRSDITCGQKEPDTCGNVDACVGNCPACDNRKLRDAYNSTVTSQQAHQYQVADACIDSTIPSRSENLRLALIDQPHEVRYRLTCATRACRAYLSDFMALGAINGNLVIDSSNPPTLTEQGLISGLCWSSLITSIQAPPECMDSNLKPPIQVFNSGYPGPSACLADQNAVSASYYNKNNNLSCATDFCTQQNSARLPSDFRSDGLNDGFNYGVITEFNSFGFQISCSRATNDGSFNPFPVSTPKPAPTPIPTPPPAGPTPPPGPSISPPPCEPDCSMLEFTCPSDTLADGCGGNCGRGTKPMDCPLSNTYCGERTDGCGNICGTGTNPQCTCVSHCSTDDDCAGTTSCDSFSNCGIPEATCVITSPANPPMGIPACSTCHYRPGCRCLLNVQ